MFGLEEEKSKPLFEFDLEKDLKGDHEKAKKLLKSLEERIHEIKNLLRQGTAGKEFDEMGTLLHGYVALQKVIQKLIEKK